MNVTRTSSGSLDVICLGVSMFYSKDDVKYYVTCATFSLFDWSLFLFVYKSISTRVSTELLNHKREMEMLSRSLICLVNSGKSLILERSIQSFKSLHVLMMDISI